MNEAIAGTLLPIYLNTRRNDARVNKLSNCVVDGLS